MFSTEPIFIEASTDIVITRLVQLSSWCTFRHIGDLIYFRPFVLFLKNQSESLLKRIFRESLVSSSLRSKERRLEVRECCKEANGMSEIAHVHANAMKITIRKSSGIYVSVTIAMTSLLF